MMSTSKTLFGMAAVAAAQNQQMGTTEGCGFTAYSIAPLHSAVHQFHTNYAVCFSDQLTPECGEEHMEISGTDELPNPQQCAGNAFGLILEADGKMCFGDVKELLQSRWSTQMRNAVRAACEQVSQRICQAATNYPGQHGPGFCRACKAGAERDHCFMEHVRHQNPVLLI